jgi:integrase
VSAGRPRGRGGDPTPYGASHKPWLSLPAAKVLRTHANQAAEALALGPAWLDSGLVFTSTVGTVIEPRNLNRFFDELIAKACVRRIRFHDLRHTCASLLA